MEKGLSLPNESLQRLPRLAWIGTSQVYIENYEHMLVFSDRLLKLQTTLGELTVQGSQLRISGIHEDEILVEGKIFAVSYGPATQGGT
jgi:sporulation protein YqfC